MMIVPLIFKEANNLVVAQSTRLGGFSNTPYNSMNLGTNTLDDCDDVIKNKRHFCESLGIKYEQVAKSKQVHGTNILVAEKGGSYEGYDSIITNQKNVFVCVSTADCVSILIFDKVNEACAAVHAGWKGTKDYLVALTLQKMKEVFGTNSKNCTAYIGACIDECSFEVDADVAQYFDDPYSRFDSNKGKYFINLKAHNKNQLLHAGFNEEGIEVSPYDTYTSTNLFYSHRKEKGITGRMWSIIGIKE
jgi:polyphenol oxidase